MAKPVPKLMTQFSKQQFTEIFTQNIPIMDTRAPVEFKQGAFPNAINLPLMTDEERAKVGTCYKHSGQDAAIKLGHKLVSGAIKNARLKQWQQFILDNPSGYLYCFRGGLRSHTVQQWLQEAGHDYPLIPGGYKAMRRFLIDTLDEQAQQRKFIVLSGRTGTGKTKILNQLPSQLDLEGHANHRGSTFGRHTTPQPSQINFEHHIAIDLLKNSSDLIYVEDESQVIGSLHIPDSILTALKSAPIIVIEKSMEDRIDVVMQDYVIDLSAEYQNVFGQEIGLQNYKDYMVAGTDRIRKRLGGVLHKEIKAQMTDSMDLQIKTGSLDSHRVWIANLLTNYYDKMYDYQLSLKQDRVIGTSNGNIDQIMAIQ